MCVILVQMRRFSISVIVATVALSCFGQHWFRPSHAQQLKLGQDAAAQIRKTSKVLPASDPRTVVVREIFGNIVQQIPEKERNSWKFSFDVIEDPQINAFALPGGPMFIYTGLLDKIDSKDALAGIIGHELTHVLREHYARQYEREANRQSLLTVVGALFKVNGNIMQAGDLVTQVTTGLTYSRSNESDADEGGFNLMVGAHYNPNSFLGVFDMFKKLEGRNGPPPYLRDHPVNDDRINHIKDLMKKDGRVYPVLQPLPPLPKTPAKPANQKK